MSIPTSKIKILLVHREYRTRGGEEAFLDTVLLPTLKSLNLDYEALTFPPFFSGAPLWRDFLELLGMVTGLEKLRPSHKTVLRKAKDCSHVIFNNFVPTLSLKLPSALSQAGHKVIWWIHNFRIDCANGLRFTKGRECNKCLSRGSRWALAQNCLHSPLQSLLYAMIYRNNRVPKTICPHIDLLICNSEYTRLQVQETLSFLKLDRQSHVIPMPVPLSKYVPVDSETVGIRNLASTVPKPFYLFLGRLTYDKGSDIFLNLAKRFPEKGFLMCGDGPLIDQLKKERPPNLIIAGHIGRGEKAWAFENCEALIIPSRSPETSSLVIAESHPYGTPIVYPSGGGAEETFLFLGRTGCSLDQFQGQTFKRSTEATKPFTAPDFSKDLEAALWNSL